jgi:squalene cyclase
MTSFRLFILLAGLLLILAADAPAQQQVRRAELSPKAEAAIDRGLAYLAKTQNPDGSWDNRNPVGVTSLALMAFMVKGHFPDKEPHGTTMAKGVGYLLQSARTGKGYLGKSMYDHGLATLALCESWGESARSDEIRDAIKQAVAVIVKSQHPGGGWRYQPDGSDRDISITVMQIVALASAKEAGILVPDETVTRALAYVKSCQNANGGFGYRGPSDPGFARTAAGVLSLQLCGERNSKEVQRGLQYLRSLPESKFNPQYMWYFYGHYYAVQAMYQAGEGDYQAWYPKISDSLVAAQEKDGSWKGGLPAGLNFVINTNRDSYCTPTAILILGVPYRFLPIYQR